MGLKRVKKFWAGNRILILKVQNGFMSLNNVFFVYLKIYKKFKLDKICSIGLILDFKVVFYLLKVKD
jgi:hypothetical protein